VTEHDALVSSLISPKRSLYGPEGAPVPAANDVVKQIQRILASRFFSKSERLCRFLRFAANHTLSGNGQHLKEYVMGVEVFDRGPTYDPRIDPIVRVEARRLRAKLKAYYASVGRDDQLRIEFPKGTYSPVFRFRTRQRFKLKSVPEAAIAVLSFESPTNSSSNAFFGDGLIEELIHQFAQIPGLQVVVYDGGSRAERPGDSLRARREVARWILRGSIRGGHGMLRVIVQLIETSSGAYIWSETYDRSIGDILSVQEGIARAVAAKLQLTLELSRISTKAS
jgi:adenylate cyclase